MDNSIQIIENNEIINIIISEINGIDNTSINVIEELEDINILISEGIDTFVTGGTYSNGSASFTNNFNQSFNVTGFTDTFVTGGTYSNGIASFTNNTGGTFNVSGFDSSDIYTTGFTFNPSTYDLTIKRNDNVNITTNLSILSSDMVVTGGTYNINTGIVIFTNNSGGTFQVSGFTSGMTDTFTTGGTYSNGTINFGKNNGGSYSVTGLFTGGLTDVTITGTSFTIDSNNTRYICTSSGSTVGTVFSGITGNIEVLRYGTGSVSFSAATGTTLRYSSFSIPSIVERYASVGFQKLVSPGEIRIYGEMANI